MQVKCLSYKCAHAFACCHNWHKNKQRKKVHLNLFVQFMFYSGRNLHENKQRKKVHLNLFVQLIFYSGQFLDWVFVVFFSLGSPFSLLALLMHTCYGRSSGRKALALPT
jgi:hypothetical protein